jgi:oxygen-independent coproporphyrinogen III oxidase
MTGKTQLESRDKQPLGAYIHIPFCNYKCHFCDFVTAANRDDLQNEYCQVLEQEIAQRLALLAAKPVVDTLFYGGGTPGTLTPQRLINLHHVFLANIKLAGDAEITLETTPETVNLEKARFWRELGINRLSIGVESFDNEELSALGRNHTLTEIISAIDLATQAGFENINCDLMYALPVQNLYGWQKSLNKFLQIAEDFPQIKHLSAYALELSPQTPLAKMFPAAGKGQKEENEFVEQHKYLLQTAPEAGFDQYEISNFSKYGFQSAHNLNYWQQGNYLAFGVSACRYIYPRRSSNWRSLHRYMRDCLGEESTEIIDARTRAKEAIMLGLRMNAGINLKQFEQTFHFDLLESHSSLISRLAESNLLICAGGRLILTAIAQPVANSIIAEFF